MASETVPEKTREEIENELRSCWDGLFRVKDNLTPLELEGLNNCIHGYMQESMTRVIQEQPFSADEAFVIRGILQMLDAANYAAATDAARAKRWA